MKDELGEALRYDALLEAEKVTGKGYKEDPKTMELGAVNLFSNSDRKKRLLKESNDSYFSMPWDEYGALLNSRPVFNFQKIYSENWLDDDLDKNRDREVAVWAEFEYGFLLLADSYMGNVNSAKMYYQIVVKKRPCNTHSGGFQNYDKEKSRGVLEGSFDAREGFFYNLNIIYNAALGFNVPWTKHSKSDGPFIWFPSRNAHAINSESFDEIFGNVAFADWLKFEVCKFGGKK